MKNPVNQNLPDFSFIPKIESVIHNISLKYNVLPAFKLPQFQGYF